MNSPDGESPRQRVGRPKKTALLVAQKIVEDIALRGNSVGDRLPPERLMLEEYGVGRGTLRESLRFLELQGVIMLKPGPGGGPIVQQPDSGTLAMTLSLLLQFENAPFSTIMEARAALEPSIARLATARIDDAGLARLKENLHATRAQVGDPEAFSAESELFHELIAWSSGNSLFGYLLDALTGLIAGASMGISYPKRQQELTCDSHDAIYEALADRDAEAAFRLMTVHIQEHNTFLQKRFHAELAEPIRWDLGEA